ncbi:hypothetical protein [Enterococcus sp. BWR-S5]|uniref:hypothetical protein n=1 Tax=Enterococcus sp. BWR-S5 TaxID=2787714 RepID=UPI0019233AD4|nr:hypothetical protein [Enterococcus sp. BWR-S5]
MKKKVKVIAALLLFVLGLCVLVPQKGEAASYRYYWRCNQGHYSSPTASYATASNGGYQHQRATGHGYSVLVQP